MLKRVQDSIRYQSKSVVPLVQMELTAGIGHHSLQGGLVARRNRHIEVPKGSRAVNFCLKCNEHMLIISLGEPIMPRPKICRRVHGEPYCTVFKPAGIPASALEEVTLTIDEFEAVRLADHEGIYHEEAAQKMNVSRQTFGRILETARRKVARVLIEGLALRIEGGVVERVEQRSFTCSGCGNNWEEPFGTGRPSGCPACGSGDFFRSGCGQTEKGSHDSGRQ